MLKYKDEFPLEYRKQESDYIVKKYKDKIPVICEKNPNSDFAEMTKRKFLSPDDITLGEFLFIIRRRLNLDHSKALFLFVDNILPPNSMMMKTLYSEKKDEDNFLYITYSGENTFGK